MSERRSRPGRITAGALGWVLEHAFIGWWNDNVPRLGASLAYYTLFALAPILVIAIGVAGLVFGPTPSGARSSDKSRGWSAARGPRRCSR